MTNEEVSTKIGEVLERFSFSNCHRITERSGVGSVQVDESTDSEDLKRELVEGVGTLVAQAYEEAMKAMCISCADGSPMRDETFHVPPVPVGRDIYYLCEAKPIRALKDSLVQEPVSSR